MKKICFPYGQTQLGYEFNEKELVGVLTSSIEEYVPEANGQELVQKALKFPIGSKRLSELSRGKQNVIIASDHTRPVPSRIIITQMLSEIRKGNPNADITILIATGCHRGTTKQELINKFGEEIVANEKIYIHDCDEKEKRMLWHLLFLYLCAFCGIIIKNISEVRTQWINLFCIVNLSLRETSRRL